MIKKFKKNIFLIFILLLTLISINSFIYINKNFSKIETRIQIKLSLKDNYKNLVTGNLFKRLELSKKEPLNNIIKNMNTNYFGAEKDSVSYRSDVLFLPSKTDFLLYKNRYFLYKEFNKNDYSLFLKKNYKLFLKNKIQVLKNDAIKNKKVILTNCLYGISITQDKNPNEKFLELKDKLDEIYENLYLNFIPIKIAIEKFNLHHYLISCMNDNSYVDFFYLSNNNNFFEDINYKFDIKFENYSNNKLIYFINIIIIISIIYINFFLLEIKKARKKYQSN
jgi:hypothetical protein